jgi:enoyl-[acyl-carrier protein] reductase III
MAVLITGGTKGIGLAIARRFAKPGVDIFMAYKRDDDSAAAASAEIAAWGARPHAIRTDVGTPVGTRDLIAKVGAVVDQLDVVVHGAVKVLAGPILDADPEAFTDATTLNGTSLVFLVQAARPLLQRGSSIIFLSSRGSRQIVPAYAAIGAGKALAEALARYLAPELAPLGVRNNCVAPGTLTPKPCAIFSAEKRTPFSLAKPPAIQADATSPTTTTPDSSLSSPAPRRR